jgi:predicted transcriptional regulator of viral defense system
MRFLEFKEKLNKFVVFNLNDIRKIKADFDLRRLNEWQKKGYIRMIRRGYYIFSDLKINEPTLFLIANKIYSPSYISLEMALAYYNLIPESVYGITSVTSQKTDNFKTPLGDFIYRHIKPGLMFGYKLVEYENHNFKIAEIEKAVLDYFYLNPHIKGQAEFFELRFNVDEFKTVADQEKIIHYLAGFNNKSLEERINKFIRYLNA